MKTKRTFGTMLMYRTWAIALTAVATFLAGSATAEEFCSNGGPLAPCFEDRVAADEFYNLDLLWQRSGSTGLVDEGSLSRFAMKGREASVRSNRTGTVLLRYPIDCRAGADDPHLRIWYKDGGPASRVQVKLIEDSFDQLEPRTVVEFDSDRRPSSAGPQVYVMRLFPREPEGIDTIDTIDAIDLGCSYASYHIEVRLSRGAGGDPRLMMLGLNGRPVEDSSYFN